MQGNMALLPDQVAGGQVPAQIIMTKQYLRIQKVIHTGDGNEENGNSRLLKRRGDHLSLSVKPGLGPCPQNRGHDPRIRLAYSIEGAFGLRA